MNKWFSHQKEISEFDSFTKVPEECCNICMQNCLNETGCQDCLFKLKSHSPRIEVTPSKQMIKSLENFLSSLQINEHLPESTPPYCEDSLAAVILENLEKFDNISDIKTYLTIFNLKPEVNALISQFIMSSFKDFSEENASGSENMYEDSENSCEEDDELISDSSEYFDSEVDDF